MSWGSAQEPAAPGGPLRLPGWAWWHLALGEWWLCHPGPPLYSVLPAAHGCGLRLPLGEQGQWAPGPVTLHCWPSPGPGGHEGGESALSGLQV